MDTVGEISVLFVAARRRGEPGPRTRYDRRDTRGVDSGHSGQGSPHHEEDVLG